MEIFKNLKIPGNVLPLQFRHFRKIRVFLPKKVFFFNFGKNIKYEINTQRLDFFKRNLLGIVNRKKKRGVLVFLRSYLEYILVRNLLIREIGALNINLLTFNEYTEFSEIKKKRAIIGKDPNQFILVTERFYYFYRYRIDNFSLIIFYSLPQNQEFYFEIINSRKIFKCLKSVFIMAHSSEVNYLEKIQKKRFKNSIYKSLN